MRIFNHSVHSSEILFWNADLGESSGTLLLDHWSTFIWTLKWKCLLLDSNLRPHRLKVTSLTRCASCWPLGCVNWHICLSFLGHWSSNWISAHHRTRSSNLGIQGQSSRALSYCNFLVRLVPWWMYLSSPAIVLQNATMSTVGLEPATLGLKVGCLAPWAICWRLKLIHWHIYLTGFGSLDLKMDDCPS